VNAEQIRKTCDDLPQVDADYKWGADLVYSIDKKMFVVIVEDERRNVLQMSFSAGHRFLELTDQPLFVPAPYLARAHWVCTPAPAKLAANVLGPLLVDAYRITVSKLSVRRQRELAELHPDFNFALDQ
jgi:predicted DNA-binding protein (MmcQ/YjbR family)